MSLAKRIIAILLEDFKVRIIIYDPRSESQWEREREREVKITLHYDKIPADLLQLSKILKIINDYQKTIT